jgi:Tetratricopeptide repeat
MLGLQYREQGNVTGAVKQFERVALGYEKTLGPNHPNTIDTQKQCKGRIGSGLSDNSS